jgi:hypothetical protein
VTPLASPDLDRPTLPGSSAAGESAAAPVRLWRQDTQPLLLTLLGLLCWWFGANSVRPAGMNDLGLVSVFNIGVLAAPFLISAGFLWSLSRRRLSVPVLVLHVVALIVVLFCTAAIIEPVPGFRILYRHAGIIDYISTHGSVDPSIDAYFNWPGFFALMSFVTEVAGIKSAVSFGPWAPAFFNLLYLGPLVMLYRTHTTKPRLIWLAVWFFYLANWIGQDYFSPQAMSYFSYLAVLAVLVRGFGPASSAAVRKLVAGASEKSRQGVLIAVVMGIFASVVPSHQLTPFAILAGVGVVVLLQRDRVNKTLLIVMGVGLAVWIAVMASTFLAGHMDTLTDSLGKVNKSASANVTARLKGTPEHLMIVRLRMGMTAGFWAAAAAGWWLRRRRGHKDGVFGLMAVATAPLVILQPYGGEMLMRVYLFALPFTAFFAASLISPRRPADAVPWRKMAPAALACLVLTASFFYTRFGNERVDMFNQDEVEAVAALYEMAPEGAFVLAGSDNLPWKATHYDSYRYETVSLPGAPAEAAAAAAANGGGDSLAVAHSTLARMREHSAQGAYVIIADSQRRHVETFGLLPPGSLEHVEYLLLATEDVSLKYWNQNARIYALNGGPTR